MKSFFAAAVLVFTAPFAFANETIEASPGSDVPEIIYMSLGTAPYNGTVTGRLTLTNRGPGQLTGIKYSIRGMGFRASDNCPKALNVGESCRIKVTFWNTFGSGSSADMTVKTSDKTYQVTIMANGLRDPWNGGNPGNPTFPPNPRIPRP